MSCLTNDEPLETKEPQCTLVSPLQIMDRQADVILNLQIFLRVPEGLVGFMMLTDIDIALDTLVNHTPEALASISQVNTHAVSRICSCSCALNRCQKHLCQFPKFPRHRFTPPKVVGAIISEQEHGVEKGVTSVRAVCQYTTRRKVLVHDTA